MPLDPAQEPVPIEIAGFVGAAVAYSPTPEHIVAGARVGRGPLAGVFEARVALAPDQLEPLATTLAVIEASQGRESNLASLQDVAGGALVAELGVPAFSQRFSGGPYVQAGLDLALVRRSTIAVSEETGPWAGETQDVPTLGGRLGVGANLSLGRHASVRAQITDTFRAADTLLVDASAAGQLEDPPLLVHDVTFTFTVVAGGSVRGGAR